MWVGDGVCVGGVGCGGGTRVSGGTTSTVCWWGMGCVGLGGVRACVCVQGKELHF